MSGKVDSHGQSRRRNQNREVPREKQFLNNQAVSGIKPGVVIADPGLQEASELLVDKALRAPLNFLKIRKKNEIYGNKKKL